MLRRPRFHGIRRLVRRLARALRFTVIWGAPVLLLAPGWIFNPISVPISGPRQAALQNEVPGLELGVSVHWYDRIVTSHMERRDLSFDAQGQTSLPTYRISGPRFRVLARQALEAYGSNPCVSCYGPNVYFALFQKTPYTPPEKMRLAQNQRREGDTLYFTVELIADERQFEERPFEIENLEALMAEVRQLIQETDRVNVSPDRFGTELRRLNPVRAEIYRGAMIVWMGGKVGYTLNPDSAGAPILNRHWMFGTDYHGVTRLESM